ncbi:hypothetical protein Fcan01_00771 [Folsomia candida]|uniref:Uncharacterized protein n=1 Tax=Folsomia candida TaxID=158441 RepID=A0A226F6W8_FOLCA|nr:hypothetical protein Fcan01_00771 [Folsomia candida]
MSSPHFSSKFSVVEFLEEKSFAAVPSTCLSEEDDKQMCYWPKVKIFRSFGSDDYKRANSNVDEARFLSSGETQSSSSDSENLNSRRNKIHSKNPVETNNLPFKAPGQATPSSSSSSAGFYSYYKFDNRRGSLCPWLRFKYLRSYSICYIQFHRSLITVMHISNF